MGLVVGALLSAALLVDGLPILGHRTQWWPLAAALVPALATGWWFRRGWAWVGRRARLVAVVAVALVGTVTVWGSVVDPVVVGGHVYASTSSTARAWRLSMQMRDDLVTMSQLDQLLAYSTADARLHNDAYQPAQAQLAAIYKRWAGVDENALPSQQFVPVIEHVKAAADFGNRAMDAKAKLVVEEDAATQAQMTSYRSTFDAEVLAAGASLRQVASLYGIDLVSSAGAPKE